MRSRHLQRKQRDRSSLDAVTDTFTVHTINLARRTDRWARCQEIGAQSGLRFVRAQAPEMPGRAWLACAWSHQLAVFDAKHRGDPFVLVAEDDLELTPAFSLDKFGNAIRTAEALGYGGLYTGTVSFPDELAGVDKFDGGSIVETTTYLSSQLTCYFAAGYEAVLHWPCSWGSDYGRNPLIGADPMGRMAMSAPVFMKRGLTVPFMSIQRSDFSDSCGRVLDLDQTWKDADEAWARAVANR